MKNFLVKISNDGKLKIPKEIMTSMELKDFDHLLLKFDSSMRLFTVYKAKIEADI